MDAISDNLANVNTVKPYDQPAFQARFIEAQELPSNPGDPVGVGGGVTAASIQYGDSTGIIHYEPGNPMANEQGLIRSPNVDVGPEHDRPDHRAARVPAESRGRRPREPVVPAGDPNQREVK